MTVKFHIIGQILTDSFSIKYQRNASLDNILQISLPNIERSRVCF